jgi:hypothetical protein
MFQRNAALGTVIHHAITHPENHEWSVQGFGMLRTYFGKDKRWRLNIWHQRLAVPLCSIIHDHPWSFESLIMAGQFRNVRYHFQPSAKMMATHEWQVIKTGPGGGPDGEHEFCILHELSHEIYTPGDSYTQSPTEIHASHYQDGCVTFNDRTRVGDGEHARVFWPAGGEWVDAMPREATKREIGIACEAARQRLEEAGI